MKRLTWLLENQNVSLDFFVTAVIDTQVSSHYFYEDCSTYCFQNNFVGLNSALRIKASL